MKKKLVLKDQLLKMEISIIHHEKLSESFEICKSKLNEVRKYNHYLMQKTKMLQNLVDDQRKKINDLKELKNQEFQFEEFKYGF